MRMAKYYKIKLTEAQYLHVLKAMNEYEGIIASNLCAYEEHGPDYGEPVEFSNTFKEYKLHEQTEEALMKARRKSDG